MLHQYPDGFSLIKVYIHVYTQVTYTLVICVQHNLSTEANLKCECNYDYNEIDCYYCKTPITHW